MLLSFFLIMILAMVHVFASKITQIHVLSRRKWLSFAGGASVSLVFLHILPELHEWQIAFHKEGNSSSNLEHHLYLLTMAGLVLFYGLEKGLIAYKEKQEAERKAIEDGIFWWHISVFAFNNMAIGVLFLFDHDMNGSDAILIAIAIAFHFLVNDFALCNHHKKTYLKTGRWIMAAAVIFGWLLGFIIEISTYFISSFFAFVAGGIILNALKEEIPKEKESDFFSFLAGSVIFSILLII